MQSRNIHRFEAKYNFLFNPKTGETTYDKPSLIRFLDIGCLSAEHANMVIADWCKDNDVPLSSIGRV